MNRMQTQHAYIRERIDLFVKPKVLEAFDKFIEYEMDDAVERLLESDSFAEVQRVYVKVPRSAWQNYTIMGITGLTEQKLMDNAIKDFVVDMRVEMKNYKPKE